MSYFEGFRNVRFFVFLQWRGRHDVAMDDPPRASTIGEERVPTRSWRVPTE